METENVNLTLNLVELTLTVQNKDSKPASHIYLQLCFPAATMRKFNSYFGISPDHDIFNFVK